MDLLIVLTYVALAWAVFKIFRIPVNQWTLATAALGGVFLVSGLILLMNYNHPYTFTEQWLRHSGTDPPRYIRSCLAAASGDGLHPRAKTANCRPISAKLAVTSETRR